VGQRHCALLVIVGFGTSIPTKQSKDRLPPIEDWQKKQLLVHIEEAGGLGVTNFKTICDIQQFLVVLEGIRFVDCSRKSCRTV
jgi:hypothetical protein